MNGKCLNCGEAFDARSATVKRSEKFTHPHPFTTLVTFTSAACAGCGKTHAVASNMQRPTRPHAWLTDDEIIPLNKMASFGKADIARIDGSLPVDIYWSWVPITDSQGVSTRLAEKIASDTAIYNPGRHSLLVMPAEEIIPEVAAIAKLFTAAVAIAGITDDTFGPYASLRAERSLSRTFAANLSTVKHYWPALTFNKNWYRPLSNESELIKAYARHHRRKATGSVEDGSDE
jgi:hypothetical protein